MTKKKRSEQSILDEAIEDLKRKVESGEAAESLAKIAGVIFVSSFLGSAIGTAVGGSLKAGKLKTILKIILS